MKKQLTFILCATTFALASCVNKDYDLSKPIDLEMNIGGKLEMPLKMEQDFSYKLDDLITLEGNNFIKKEVNGDYKFVIQPSEGFKTNYVVQSLSFNGISESQQALDNPVYFTAGLNHASSSIFGINDISISISKQIAINTSGIDDSIKKVGTMFFTDTYMTISLKPYTSGGATSSLPELDFEDAIQISLPNSMKFEFVSFTRMASETIDGDVKIENGALIIPKLSCFTEGIEIKCKVSSLSVNQKLSTTGSLNVDLGFKTVFPAFYVTTSTTSNSVKYNLVGSVEIGTFTVKKAEVVAVPELKCDNVELDIDVPADFQDGGAFNFELEDLCFKLTATNQTPFDFKLSTELVSYNGRGEENARKPVGSKGSEILVPSGTTDKNFYISESGKYGESQDEKIAVPGLTGLVSPIPDKFAIENIKVTGLDVDNAEYITLNFGDQYSVAVNYSLETPFSFKKVSLETEQVAALGVDLGNVGFNDLYLAASVVNTLPLNIDLDCQMLDDAHQVVENVEVLVVILDEAGNAIDYVPAGSVQTPATSKLRLAFVSKDSSAVTAIQQLNFKITATSPEGTVATLNAEQSLVITDFVAGTESGIYINPESNKNE